MRCFALPCFGLPYTLYIYTYTHVHMLYMYGESMTFATDLTACHHLTILSRSKDHLQSSGTFAGASSTTWARRTQRSDAVLTATMLVSCIWFSCILICTYIYINVPSISSTYPISHYQPWACPARSQCFMADLQWSTMRRVGVRSLMLFCSHRKKWISFFWWSFCSSLK